MTAYDRASRLAKIKLLFSTEWQHCGWHVSNIKAEENIVKTINTDLTYAPAYKAKLSIIKFSKDMRKLLQSLINYTEACRRKILVQH